MWRSSPWATGKRGHEVWLIAGWLRLHSAWSGSPRRAASVDLVLVLTRSDVLDVRSLVTIVEISTTIRGHAAEVDFDHLDVGLDRESVINCDGLDTVAQNDTHDAGWRSG